MLIAAFLVEMRRFTGEPGRAVPRIAATVLAVAYIGVLPCFFAQIRFLHGHSALLLALVIFVPKGNDIAAFFTGTFVGRHKMTPLLSPKKTWQGFAGGMTGGVLVAVGVWACQPAVFPHGAAEAVGFGLAVGLAGVFGDCIAGGGYMPIISDRVYMTEQAYMVIAGAALIKGAKSQKITSLDIGGPEVHVHQSGCADVRVPDDDVAIACLRREVARLPSSGHSPMRAAPPEPGPCRSRATLQRRQRPRSAVR